ncbi:MAG: choice-of-anchor U domain-containing protein [Myxococcota bacterium]
MVTGTERLGGLRASRLLRSRSGAARVAVVGWVLLGAMAPGATAAPVEGLTGVVENRGQAPDAVRFVGRAAGQVLFFDTRGVTHVPRAAEHSAVRLEMLGANPDPEVAAAAPLPGVVNRFRGQDPAGWQDGLARFAQVRYTAIYPGIDLVFNTAQGELKRDFLVAAGADPAEIAFRYLGASSVDRSPGGALLIDTGRAVLTEAAPVAWQVIGGAREQVAVDYAVDPEGRVSFDLGAYDPAHPLLIDPGLDFAAYVGGNAFDEVNAVTTDASGNVYIAGSTTSADLPMDGPGAAKSLQTNSLNGKTYVSTDAFVAKLSPDGALVWATYLGGKTDKFPSGICLDVDPPTDDPNYICNQLVPSPWGLGGIDVAHGLDVGSPGSLYVVGQTTSTDFPIAPIGAVVPQSKLAGRDFDPQHPGAHYASDAFYANLSKTNGGLTISTYLGGSGLDVARGVAIDDGGAVWVVGHTASADFPTTADRLQPWIGGPAGAFADDATAAFVVRMGPLLGPVTSISSRLEYATTLGGYGFDEANAVAVNDHTHEVIVVGSTSATDFGGDALNGPQYGPQASYGGGHTDGFIAVLDVDAQKATSLTYLTYFGGPGADEINDVAFDDSAGQRLVYVVGATSSPGLWSSECAANTYDNCGSDGNCDYDGQFTNYDDAFVAKLDLATPGGACGFVRYLGGQRRDLAHAVDIDTTRGDVYVTGTTWSVDFPTVAAFQPRKADGRSAGCLPSDPFDCASNSDAFFARVSPDGKDLLMASFLGGTGDAGDLDDDAGLGIAFSDTALARRAYLVGRTHSPDFPHLAAKLDQPTVIADANGYLVRVPVDVADLAVTLDVPKSVKRGADFTLTATVHNDGPEATAFALSGEVPAGFTVKSVPPGCTHDLSTAKVQCAPSTPLARGGERTYPLTLTAPDTVVQVSFEFAAAGTVRDPYTPNNTAQATTLVGGAELTIEAATCTRQRIGYKETTTCSMAAKNAGPDDATHVEAQLEIPQSGPDLLEFVAAQSSPGCVAKTAGGVLQVSCPLASTLAKGATTQPAIIKLRPAATTARDFDARVTMTVSSDALALAASAPRGNVATTVVQVRYVLVAVTAFTATPEPVGIGKPLTYSVTVENRGPGDAQNPPILMALPDPTMALLTTGTDPRCKAWQGSVHCDLGAANQNGKLAEGESLTWKFVVSAPTSQKVITSTVYTDSFNGGVAPAPDPSASRSVASHVGWADVQVSLIEFVDPASPPYKQAANATIVATLHNLTADVDADGVVVEYAAQTSALGHSGATHALFGAPTAGVYPGGPTPTCVEGPPIRCTFPKIAASPADGAATPVTMKIISAPVRAGTQTHTFRIVGATTPDPAPLNNTGSKTQPISGFDVALALSGPTDALVRGVPARFTAEQSNLGPGSTVPGGVFTVTYDPANWAWAGQVSHDQPPEVCVVPSPETGTVKCATNSAASGGLPFPFATTVFELTPKKKGPLPIVFAATGRWAADDVNRTNDRVAPFYEVLSADLSLHADPPATVEVGDTVTYKVLVQNLGKAASVAPKVIHTFPAAHLDFVGMTGATGCTQTVTGATATVVCTGMAYPAEMATAAELTIQYTATKSGTFTSTFLATDGAGAVSEDQDPSDNSGSVATKIDGPDLRIEGQTQAPANPVGSAQAVRTSFDVVNPSTKEASGAFQLTVSLSGAAGKGKIVLAEVGGVPCQLGAGPTPAVAHCLHVAGLPKAVSGSPPPKLVANVDVLGLGRGTYTMDAWLAPVKPDPDTTNNVFRPGPLTTVREGYDLSVALTVDPAKLKRGGATAPYTVTVTNSRASTADNAKLEVFYPDGRLSKMSATVSGGGACAVVEPPGLMTCDLGNLAKGQSATVTLAMNGVREGVSPVTYTAYADRPELEENKANDKATEQRQVVGANLTVSQIVWPASPIGSGKTVTLKATVKNASTAAISPATSKPVTFVHTGFGDHYRLAPGSAGSFCAQGAGKVTCQLGTMAAGAEVELSLTYLTDKPGTFIDTLEVSEPAGTVDEAPNDNQAARNDGEVTGPDLVIERVSADTEVGLGDYASVTYRVRNASTTLLAEKVKLRLTPRPGGTGALKVPAAQAVPCATLPSGVVECELGDLTAGASSADAVVQFEADKAGTVTVDAVASELTGKDMTPANNADALAILIKGPDLAATVGPTPISPATQPRNQPFTYTVTVANLSTAKALNAALAVSTDASVRFVSGTVSGGQGACKPASSGAQCELADTAVYPLTVALTLRPTRAGTFSLVATATAKDDTNPANNSAPATSFTVDGADLSVAISASAAQVISGETTDLVVEVRNAGPADADQVRLVHAFDFRHLRFVGSSPPSLCHHVAGSGQTVCQFGPLAKSALQQITLTYRGVRAGAVTSSVTVDEPGLTDPTPADTTASFSTQVRGADLGLALTDAPDPVAALGTITYQGVVTNYGPAKAENVVTRFTLPPEVNFQVSTSPDCRQTTAVSRTVDCVFSGVLPVGDSLSYTLLADAITPTTTASCSATTESDPGDDGAQPNSASVGTTITSGDPDADGVPDAVEDGAPNNGDGNGDGIRDKSQPEVSSTKTSAGDYVTLVTSAGALKAVTSQAPAQPTPAGVAFPVDAISYQIAGLAPGASVTVQVILSTGIPAWAYWKYGPEPGNATPHWYDFSFDGSTGAVATNRTTLTLTFVDGGRGDDDQTANGTITDPGAPALRRLVVDSEGGGADLAPGDGLCNAGGGACTLRAAIEEANANPDYFYIGFDVPDADGVLGVSLGGALPTVTQPLVIDGTTQPGYAGAPIVAVQGSGAWSVTAGDSALRGLSTGPLRIEGAGHVCVTDGFVDGLTIDGVPSNVVRRSVLLGPRISGGPAFANRILDCEIPAGGLVLENSSAALVRGCSIYGAFGTYGVDIVGQYATANLISGNLIGLGPDGECTSFGSDPGTNTAGAGPCTGGASLWGVRIAGGANNNLIGGELALDGNVISGNGQGGVLIVGGGYGNRVAGNLIGTDTLGLAERHAVSGTYQLSNQGPCVVVDGSSDNVIGGDSPGWGNICADRGMVVRGGDAERNVVQGNWVMLDARGDVPWVRLSLDDVLLVDGAVDTLIDENVVPTIEVTGAANGTEIRLNRIGTDSTGSVVFYADTSTPGTTRIWSRGVMIHGGASSTRVNDNVIGGSYLHGVDIWEDAGFVTLTDNKIGVDATGLSPLPNYKAGIHADSRFGGGVHDLLIADNIVAANGPAGVFAHDLDYPFSGIWLREGTARATVRDNVVGLGGDGLTPMGHQAQGIWANGAPDVLIEGNRVGANLGDGIRVDDGPGIPYPSVNAVVRKNTVGTDLLGLADLGNGGQGIHVQASSGVQIGGVGPGEGNTVAHNALSGIWIESAGTMNTARGNSAFDNGWLGLDLNFLGVDPQDGQSGSTTNSGIDYPTLTGATSGGGLVTVAGTLQHSANATYTVDLYLDAVPDPTGHGEGRTWLGAVEATTDGSGAGAFSAPVDLGGAAGAFVSATATDSVGNTSELSHYTWIDAPAVWTDLGVGLGEAAGSEKVCAGAGITYSAVVRVSGPAAADDVVLSFTYPPGVTRVQESGGPFSCTFAAPVATCTAATLAPGTYTPFFIGTATQNGLPEAAVSVTTATTDANLANNADTEQTVVGLVEFGVEVLPAGPAAVGLPVEVSARVDHGFLGGCPVPPVVTLPLPPGATFAGADPDTGSCAEAAGVVTCTLDPVAAGAETTVRVSLVPAAADEVTLTMTVGGESVTEVEPADNASSVVLTVHDAVSDLVVAHDAVAGFAGLGELFETAVTVTNKGPSPAANVVLTDTLPDLATLALGDVTATKGTCVPGLSAGGQLDGTLVCALGTLAAGEAATVRFGAAALASGLVFNEACAEAVGLEATPNDNCSTFGLSLGPVDLHPAVSGAPNPVETGSPLVVTVTLDNDGPTTAVNAGFRTTLPVTARFDGAGAGADCALGHDDALDVDLVICAVGDIPSGQSAAVELTFTPLTGPLFFATTWSQSDSYDTATFNDSTAVSVAVTPASSGSRCPVGRQLATLLPDDSETGGAGWITSSNDFCNAPDCTAAVWGLSPDAASDGDFSWHIPAIVGQSWTTNVSPAFDLSGDIVDPELVFWHRWDYPASDGGRVWLSIDGGATFIIANDWLENGPSSFPAGLAFQPGYSGQSPAWPAFERSVVDLSVRLGDPALRLGFLSGTASSSAGGPGWWVDQIAVEACVPAVVGVDADVSLALTGPGAAEVLTPLSYTVTAENAGPLDATGVSVALAVGAGLELYSPDCGEAPGGLVCALGTVAAGAARVVTLTGTATAPGSPGIAATATAAEPDPAPANNTAAVTTAVSGDHRVDLSVSVASAPAALDVGESGVVRFAVANAGPDSADVVFDAALPPGVLTADATTPSAGACSHSGGVVTCALGALAPSGSATVELTLAAIAPAAATIAASVTLADPANPPTAELQPSDNTVTVEVSVVQTAPSADLAVAVEVEPSTVLLEDASTASIAVVNLGPDAATELVVAVGISGDAVFADPTTDDPQAVCDGASGTCTIADLAPGGVWLISWAVTPASVGAATVEAAVTSATGDPVAANDSASATVTALAPVAGLSLAWTLPAGAKRHAEPFSATVTASNAGPLHAAEVSVRVTAAGVRVVEAPDGCEAGAVETICDLGTVEGSASKSLVFTLLADAPGPASLLAVGATTTPDATAADDSASAALVVLEGAADLAIAATLGTPAPAVGQPVQITFDVSHLSGDDAHAVHVFVGWPAGAASPAASSADGTCVVAADGAACDLGTLLSGGGAAVTVAYTPTSAGVQVVSGSATAATADPAPGDNVVFVSVKATLACGGSPCDDGNPCTADVCDPLAGCTSAPAPGSCNDGDPCTTADACLGGVCVGGGPVGCDDGDACTFDLCAPDTGCAHLAAPLVCDDGSACTLLDLCVAGTCTGFDALDCADDDDCTLNTCVAASGCVTTAAPGCCTAASDCDDGNPCTADSCDTDTGDCVYDAVGDGAPCDADKSVCTVDDACVAGICEAGEAADCDDGEVCTSDSCQAASGCVNSPVAGCCEADLDCDEDADPCTRAACETATGVCGQQPVADGAACDADGSVCTEGDACVAGVCTAGGALACDDGSECTSETCDDALGCVVTALPSCCESDADCPSVAPACKTYRCEIASGACLTEPVADGTACDADKSVCTPDDACSAGLCVAGFPAACDDARVCTTDTCDPVVGCQNALVAGCCEADSDCAEDANPCTAAACDLATGACGQAPAADGTACDADQSACTTGDACAAGTCAPGPALACDDGDDCTIDRCDALAGCQHEASSDPACTCEPAEATAACDDSGHIVWSDACGVAGAVAVSCDDGDEATDDRCDPVANVCLHVPAGAADCDVTCAGDWTTRCEGDHLVWLDPCGAVAGIATPCAVGDPCPAAACAAPTTTELPARLCPATPVDDLGPELPPDPAPDLAPDAAAEPAPDTAATPDVDAAADATPEVETDAASNGQRGGCGGCSGAAPTPSEWVVLCVLACLFLRRRRTAAS